MLEGWVRILLTANPQEIHVVSLHDGRGITRLCDGLRQDGEPFFVLWDANGTALFEIP